MSNKVKLIKQEIERRIENLSYLIPDISNIGNLTMEDVGYYAKSEALKSILQFIDSLPEESESEDRINECGHWDKNWGCSTSPMNNCDSCPQAKWVEVKDKEKIKERYKKIIQTEQFRKSYCSKSLRKEKSASEDLEEYAKKLAKGAALDKHNLIWMCKKGAEWQKQQDEELFSEDTWNYIEENYPNITEEEKLRLYDISIKSRLAGADTLKKRMKEVLQTEYEKGRFDMREEMMMKDAIDATILDVDAQTIEFGLWPEKLLDIKEGDKVKIIVIKEE